ncbi:MAG: SCO family protein [Nitrospiraceae bacterium]|nr:SCO family protein [Nitrospiraceae bacterium]
MRGIAGLITAAFSLAMLAPSIALADSAAPVIPDVEVLDETGTSHRFYSDLIKGKTVAINFVYTACASSCPASAALFNGVQHRLRTQPERAVSLLSVSIDPTTDRPAQLQAYAEKFGRGAGWTFVTGSKREIDRLLAAFGLTASDKVDHPALIVVGNDASGVWTRLYGQASVPMVMEALAAASAVPASAASPLP